MALYNPYCTIADVITHTKNSDLSESFLEKVVNEASRFIEDYTKRLYHYYDYTLVGYTVPKYDYLNGTMIYLPFPVLTITSITIDGSSVSSSDFSYVTKPSSYKARSEVEIEDVTETDFLGQKQSNKGSKAIVYGDFGFTAASNLVVPDDIDFPSGIRRAATIIASVFSEQKRSEQVTLDGDRVSLQEYSIPQEVYDILKMHKKHMPV